MINLISISLLIVASAMIYLIALVIKNFVSRWNLKRALGIDYGTRLIECDESSRSISYRYTKEFLAQGGPDIIHFIICVGTYRNSDGFIIVRERLFDKIFKVLSICNELQTGHYWFDKRYYIVSESNETLQRLLTLEPVCQCIDSLLSEGFDYIKFEDGVLKTGFNTFTGWRWFKSDVIERSAKQLIRLSDFIEKHLGSEKKRQKKATSYYCEIEGFAHFYIHLPDKTLKHHPKKWVRQRKRWLMSAGYVAVSGFFILFIGIFFTPYPVVIFEELFNKSLIYVAFPIMVLHLFAAGVHLVGRSRSHIELSFIALCNGFGYSFIAIFMFQTLNGFLDDGPVMSHSSKLVAIDHTSSNKGPDHYYVIVESWLNTANTKKLEVTRSFYNRSEKRINKPIYIQTKAGAFDLEWLYSYSYKSKVPRF